MEARRLISSASYGPDELKVLFKAFDEAWANVAHLYSSHHVSDRAIEVGQLRLAIAILVAAPQHGTDIEALKNAALQHMALHLRGTSDPTG